MIIIYNIIQLIALVFLAPLLVVFALLAPRYRHWLWRRLGWGVSLQEGARGKGPRIWLHALSVGEVASSAFLLRQLKKRFPDSFLVLTVSTRSGYAHAGKILSDDVDCLLPFPLDIYPVVSRFISRLDPHCFILVETDFWPNILSRLSRQRIPSLLVNGRVSRRSFDRYQRFSFFFKPLFDSFQRLVMQRDEDVQLMSRLGIKQDKLESFGNLKYDSLLAGVAGSQVLARRDCGIPEKAVVLVAGSTHEGEEEELFAMWVQLCREFPGIFLVVAPRQIERTRQLLALAEAKGLAAYSRTGNKVEGGRVLVVNTMGELASLYKLADYAFVGGSLVAEGGHNLLEPAVWGKPVFFGKYMDDFADIAGDMLAAEAGIMVADGAELALELRRFFADPVSRQNMEERARDFVAVRQGVTHRHVDLVAKLLNSVRQES